MISRPFAAGQIARLAGLHYFPEQPEAQDELVKALEDISKTEEEADELIYSWIRFHREAPTPFDLYELATPEIEVPELP